MPVGSSTLGRTFESYGLVLVKLNNKKLIPDTSCYHRLK